MMLEPNFNALRILKLFIQSTARQYSGYTVAKNLGIKSNTGYNHLRRMESDGLIESEWEPADTAILGRPLRRFYRLTPDGLLMARVKLRSLQMSSL